MRRLKKIDLDQIKELRENGFSIPEISVKLDIPKSTVFNHISDIQIKPEHRKYWTQKRGGSIRRMLLKQEEANKLGKEFVDNFSWREKFVTLAVLYWGEGNKKDLSLSNTDPRLIKTFVSLIKEVFNVNNDRLRAGIRLYEDLDKEECLDFWSKLTGIKKENFTGIQILNGKKIGKLKYGMCRIRLLKGEKELKRLKGLYNAIGDLFVPIA